VLGEWEARVTRLWGGPEEYSEELAYDLEGKSLVKNTGWLGRVD
jgi:hypothetical protein